MGPMAVILLAHRPRGPAGSDGIVSRPSRTPLTNLASDLCHDSLRPPWPPHRFWRRWIKSRSHLPGRPQCHLPGRQSGNRAGFADSHSGPAGDPLGRGCLTGFHIHPPRAGLAGIVGKPPPLRSGERKASAWDAPPGGVALLVKDNIPARLIPPRKEVQQETVGAGSMVSRQNRP